MRQYASTIQEVSLFSAMYFAVLSNFLFVSDPVKLGFVVNFWTKFLLEKELNFESIEDNKIQEIKVIKLIKDLEKVNFEEEEK